MAAARDRRGAGTRGGRVPMAACLARLPSVEWGGQAGARRAIPAEAAKRLAAPPKRTLRDANHRNHRSPDQQGPGASLLLEVEYGEIDRELVGHRIVRALSLINNLEINEQILYARMINIEKTTLIV
jgi:hypothetical protein